MYPWSPDCGPLATAFLPVHAVSAAMTAPIASRQRTVGTGGCFLVRGNGRFILSRNGSRPASVRDRRSRAVRALPAARARRFGVLDPLDLVVAVDHAGHAGERAHPPIRPMPQPASLERPAGHPNRQL